MQAEELLREDRLDEALQELQEQVRNDPADAKLRVFLFQLLSVLGKWDRAMTQLNVAAELDPQNLLMAQVCRPALNCEAFRTEVFAGKREPLLLGEPTEWVGWMVQANKLAAGGEYEAAAKLRGQAFEAAPAIGGRLTLHGQGTDEAEAETDEDGAGEPFEWVADVDSRLGPILEVIVEGRYYWVPFEKIRQVRLEEPSDLRDRVWMPAYFTWANGGEVVGLVPTRYAGSESSDDPAVVLAKKTQWQDAAGGHQAGLGVRLLATDAEFPEPIMRIGTIALNVPEPAESAGGPEAAADEGGAEA